MLAPFSSHFDVHPDQDIPGPRTSLHDEREDARMRAVYPHAPPINQSPLRLNYRGTRP